ncbi:MAG: hypothetical protein F6J86_38205 [Symploca sp. SIO1B1]|nr:hypothetical protein [Symploca sp. SIO1B1]
MSHQPNIKKIAEIITLVLSLMGGSAYSKTKLVKIVYLLDVIQARKGNKHFSTATYKSYYYGPYSDDIDDAINLLTDFGYVEVGQRTSIDGNTYYTFKLRDTPFFGELSQKEKNDISQDTSQLAALDLKKILDVAYSTKEYDNTQFGEEVKL